MCRAIHGQLDVRVAACAEEDDLLARLVDGAIADQPDVAGNEAPMRVEDLLEMRR
jgi:hypothetical protein